MEELQLHPTVKPVQMIAGEKTGRRPRLCELDHIYCARILARWESHAQDEAEQMVYGYEAAARREAAE